MKLVIHDLTPEVFEILCPNQQDLTVVSDNGEILPCDGCLACWVTTPGVCRNQDGYGTLAAELPRCEEVVLISRCVYGSYSPFVKNVLDRCLPGLLPDFVVKNGETHRRLRRSHSFRLSAWFYGEGLRETEKLAAEQLVRRNAATLGAREEQTGFVEEPNELRGKIV